MDDYTTSSRLSFNIKRRVDSQCRPCPMRTGKASFEARPAQTSRSYPGSKFPVNSFPTTSWQLPFVPGPVMRLNPVESNRTLPQLSSSDNG